MKNPFLMAAATLFALGMAHTAIAHSLDIYGQMVVYLRLNGIVPPASRGGGL